MSNDYARQARTCCANCGAPATEITRIGYLCDDCFKHLEEICDFCSDLSPLWIYPCNGRFLITPTSVNNGAWLACGACHELIEDGKWEAVLARSLKLYSDMEQEFQPIIKSEVARIHALFREHRAGDAIRIGSA